MGDITGHFMYKWLILFCISFLTFGSYWVFDTPGAIQTQLQDWFGGEDKYSNSDNLLLYSVYSYPNMVLAFFGGLLADWLGARMAALIFSGLIFIGQVVFSFGVAHKMYWLMVLGRLIFGLGGESLTVCTYAFTARWFDGALLALALGFTVSFSRVGSSINFVVTPPLADAGVEAAVWVGTGMCGLSFCIAMLLAFLDWYGRHRCKDVSTDEKISILDILTFKLPVWILVLICAFFYIAILSFNTVASDIMQKTGPKFSPSHASLLLSIPSFVSIILSPIFGRVVDVFGRSLFWVSLASTMVLIAHVAFLSNANEWVHIPEIPAMIWLGTGYSLGAASIWPMLAYIVPESKLGTGYGLMTAVQNCALAVVPQVIGAIQTNDSIKNTSWKYTIPLIIFIGCAGTALTLAFLLIGVDRRMTGGKLNSSSAERKLAESAMAEQLLPAAQDGGLDISNYSYSKAARVEHSTISRESLSSLAFALPRSPAYIRSAYFNRLGIQAPTS